MFLKGIPDYKIRPFRLFNTCDLNRTDQQLYSRADKVFKAVVDMSVVLQLVITKQILYQLTVTEWDTIFNSVYIYDEVYFRKKSNCMKKPGVKLVILQCMIY
jgi:hypothetical protein